MLVQLQLCDSGRSPGCGDPWCLRPRSSWGLQNPVVVSSSWGHPPWKCAVKPSPTPCLLCQPRRVREAVAARCSLKVRPRGPMNGGDFWGRDSSQKEAAGQ